MSYSITRPGAVWVFGDAEKRKLLDNVVDSAIGNKKNLNGLPPAITRKVVDYLEEYPSFGESEWNALCGEVDPAPLLPHDFSVIWNGECPIYPGKKRSEIQMLVYIPAAVDGKPFTLKKLGMIAKRFFPRTEKGYRSISPDVVGALGDKSIKSCWVLMTKEPLPESIGKSNAEQQEIVAKVAEKSLGYEVTGTLEASTCILTQFFLDSKTRLFTDYHIRCKEEVDFYRVMVGGFVPAGLAVNYISSRAYENIGVAALRKLSCT